MEVNTKMDKFADSINYTVRLADSDDYTKIKECFHSGNTVIDNDFATSEFDRRFVSYVVISAYLQQFAYRTAIHWWVFVLSLVAVMAITVTIVTLRSLRAATSDPVESLRTE